MSQQSPTRLDRLRLNALQARMVALLVVVALVLPLSWIGRLGQGLVVAPAVFAIVLVASVLIAELASRRDARGRHSAAFEVRRIRDYVSTWLVLAATASLLVLVVAAAWTTAVAGADDLGRAGRSFNYTCVSGGCDSGSFGPFPGSFYTVPMFIGLAAVLILAAVTLRFAVRRPRNGADPSILEIDDQVRRTSIVSTLAAVTLASSGSLVGVGFYAGRGLLSNWSELAGPLHAVGVLLMAAGVAGLVLMCWAFVMLIAPLVVRIDGADPTRHRSVPARW